MRLIRVDCLEILCNPVHPVSCSGQFLVPCAIIKGVNFGSPRGEPNSSFIKAVCDFFTPSVLMLLSRQGLENCRINYRVDYWILNQDCYANRVFEDVSLERMAVASPKVTFHEAKYSCPCGLYTRSVIYGTALELPVL